MPLSLMSVSLSFMQLNYLQRNVSDDQSVVQLSVKCHLYVMKRFLWQ
jgi:hypothetical protein